MLESSHAVLGLLCMGPHRATVSTRYVCLARISLFQRLAGVPKKEVLIGYCYDRT